MHPDIFTFHILWQWCHLVIYFSILMERTFTVSIINNFTFTRKHLPCNFQYIIYTDCGLKYMGSHHSVGAEEAGGILDLVLMTMIMTMMVVLIYGIKTHVTAYRMNNWLFDRWLFYNPKDQDGQLQWLAETLLQAEAAGEKVHILGHIPSGDSQCYRTWSREFHKIVDRLVTTLKPLLMSLILTLTFNLIIPCVFCPCKYHQNSTNIQFSYFISILSVITTTTAKSLTLRHVSKFILC